MYTRIYCNVFNSITILWLFCFVCFSFVIKTIPLNLKPFDFALTSFLPCLPYFFPCILSKSTPIRFSLLLDFSFALGSSSLIFEEGLHVLSKELSLFFLSVFLFPLAFAPLYLLSQPINKKKHFQRNEKQFQRYQKALP